MDVRMFCFFLLNLLNTFGTRSTVAAMLGNQTDRLALLAFKNQINHDPLGALSSWNDSLHFCQWQGVSCGSLHQRVTALNLEGKMLVGSVSPSIGNLSFLTEINLQNNSFHGQIPQEISLLPRLQHLVLSQNSFSEGIPTNLSRCSHLKVLDLYENELTGIIPTELGSLSQLVNLVLAKNNLTGVIPASLGNLSSLEMLSLTRNGLDGSIPYELGQLSRLTFLGIGAGRLSGTIPSSLYNLSSINLFSVVQNQLSGSLPPDLGLKLPNLQVFAVGVNQFTGQIPGSLTNASGLQILSFHDNYFTGPVPSNLGELKSLLWVDISNNSLGDDADDDLSFLTSLINCSSLTNLGFANNHLRGLLPNSVANLSTKLTTLEMGGNQIVGSIPIGIENLLQLTLLGMDRNFFSGSILATIGTLQSLQKLLLNKNRFTGQVPSSLGNLSQLYELHLEENLLEGPIPSTLGDCQHLQLLNLSKNSLNGKLPKQVLGLSSLDSLNLAGNSLTGSLPLEVGSLRNLRDLDVSENKLSGEIPSTLGNCLGLERLHMQGNFFQGIIPPSLRNLRVIQVLDISRNNFSGEVPKFLESFPFLLNLNLSLNDFEGEVPTEGVFRNSSAFSVAQNGKLCGGIPILQLPTCSKKSSNQKSNKHVLITIISVVLCLTLASCFVTIYWIRKSRQKTCPTFSGEDWSPMVSYERLSKVTNGFSLDKKIGVGSHGSVYKATLDEDKTVVAVKVLNLQQRGALISFLAECETLRNVRHRNLVKILKLCSSMDFQGNDFKALVFEFMHNGSLEKWLHPEANCSRNLNFIQRLSIAIDVASALEYLHHYCQIPIVHCDLKPSNVLLDDELNAKVGDFGLARFLSKTGNQFSESRSNSVGIRGTIGYVPPEYGMGGELSTSGDVYSYGILLLETFTGKRPTDDMFVNEMNLHKFAKMALPEKVMDIIDPRLITVEEEETIKGSRIWNYTIDTMEECLVSVIRIGVACSEESPRERMDMEEVGKKLHLIRDLCCW
ncbi:PREDICTED: putative receptor-like protein kinase At3g47110 [Nelumbo nucifera]|uniref:non-specific serine/threonine protein kinase n=2 Tax=Nelumbo nucifera TaxID=4432 RepID=A0A822YG29_NELNU|nr:PREDICTED: putative receptor-like protein kinase At3g47110 [Nelumbo nucifera]DAD28468.1 TPA_asm: hypothetical protein HUJ06_029936 [Nelumbo nucifera]